MEKINNFSKFELIKEESSPRLPNSEEYWIKKGKSGKNVALYIHDDLDGIFCGVEMRKYLINKGFTIKKYGVLNYTEGWKYTTLDPTLINIVLDFDGTIVDTNSAIQKELGITPKEYYFSNFKPTEEQVKKVTLNSTKWSETLLSNMGPTTKISHKSSKIFVIIKKSTQTLNQ